MVRDATAGCRRTDAVDQRHLPLQSDPCAANIWSTCLASLVGGCVPALVGISSQLPRSATYLLAGKDDLAMDIREAHASASVRGR